MGSIKFPHASGNGMSIAAPATNPASDLELKLPATVGTAGQVLKNSSTAGTLEFGDAGLPSGLTYGSSTLTVTGHIKADGGFGINEPGFVASMVGDEAIDNSTNHKFVNWSNYTAAYNPGWDATNDKFTVPTGGAGKYLFGWKICIGDSHQQHMEEDEYMKIWLAINGSGIGRSEMRSLGNSGNRVFQCGTVVWDLADADYIEMYGWHNEGARVDIDDDYSLFWGFRLAEGD